MGIRAPAAAVFDRIEGRWSSEGARRLTSQCLLLLFFGGLVLIELSRRGALPSFIDVPQNHFVAVEWVVDLLLLFELVDLVLGLASSVANSVAKQLEIFALILLRKSFEELKFFHEPINLSELPNALTFSHEVMPLWEMGADAVGAVGIFGALVVYGRLQQHRRITGSESDLERFVQTKKLVSLSLLGVLAFILIEGIASFVLWGRAMTVYPDIFTAFIFFDIAIVLISMRYSQQFRVVFRNFGFTVVTVFLRLALTANPFERAILGFAVGLYAVAVAWLYNKAAQSPPDGSDAPSSAGGAG